MVGVKQTALRPGELLAAVTVPLLDGWQGYAKVGVRNAMVIAISGACLAVDEPSRSVRLALGSVAPTIVRAAGGGGVRSPRRSTGRTERSPPRAVAEFGRLAAAASEPDRRPPLDGRLPAALDRRPRPAPAAPGVHRHRRRTGAGMSERVFERANQRHGATRCTSTAPIMRSPDAWLGESLLYVLRERLGLYGAKGACEQGECGSCSVLVDGALVCSCLVLGGQRRRRTDRHDRGHRRRRRAADRRPAGIRRCRRRAVRVLHAGVGDGGS